MAKTYAAGLFSSITAAATLTAASRLPQTTFSDADIPSSSSKVRNDNPRTTTKIKIEGPKLSSFKIGETKLQKVENMGTKTAIKP
jgi:hypothetical protein